MEELHRPVLLDACVQALAIQPDETYVDATVGMGGHSAAIADKLRTGTLIGLDKDPFALETAQKRLAVYGDRVKLFHYDFCRLEEALKDAGVQQVMGILFDLGVSSPQLDRPERGFSYHHDAPLDMRMDPSGGQTAEELVNSSSHEDLSYILSAFGEERYASRIAAAIIRRREQAPIQTTGELAAIVAGAMPPKARHEDQHPARRSFQAIRIAVNGELSALQQALPMAIDALAPGGRLAVISFHSLEDRIVKTVFRQNAVSCTCPPDFPVCVCGANPKLRLIGKSIPGATEDNPRARSARLRVAEKISEAP